MSASVPAPVNASVPARTVRSTAVAALLVLVVAVLASGCGDSAGTLDQPSTERSVGRSVAASVEPKVVATTCPSRIDQATGSTFRCTVTLGDGAGTLHLSVRQTDDHGTLKVTPLEAVVSGASTSRQLKAQLAKQFKRTFHVDCGPPGYRVRAPHTTFSCVARDQTSRRTVTATVRDAAGTLAFVVLPELKVSGG